MSYNIYYLLNYNLVNYNFYQNLRNLRISSALQMITHNYSIFDSYDVIVLTETWLSPNTSNSELDFKWYQIFRLGRNSNISLFSHGGVILLAV